MLKFKRAMVAAGILVTLAVLAPNGPAVAGTCGATSTCTFELTNSNVTQLNGNIDIRVTWNNTGSTTVLSVQWISGGPGTPGFINEFGYNSDDITTAIGGNIGTSKWSYIGFQKSEDGFGSFASADQGTALGQNHPGVGGAITFTLATKITSIADNANGAEFVAHVGGFPTGCSGWVSDGTSSGPESDANCGVAAIPEPATLFLAGTGLVGFGFFARKRWAKGLITT
jgi:hypothetical protein